MKRIPVAEPDLSSLELEYLVDAFKSGWISSLGAYIEKFETGFADLCGTKYAVSVSNGTVGLHLTLVALKIKPGDEVIVPSLTFVATAAAVRHAGATPVFVDCDSKLGTMDPSSVANAVTDKTKAIIAVHLYGHPCDMDALSEISSEHGIPIIEDAAEAHGALFGDRVVGGIGTAGVFSFYGNKLLTTGEGGAITTNDPALNKRLRFLRDHAMDPSQRYWHPEVGYNYRLTNMQAAIGVAQIERFESIVKKRNDILAAYRKSSIAADFRVEFNPSEHDCTPAPWLVCAWLPPGLVSNRDEICSKLRNVGIDTRPFFYPLHSMPPYRDCRTVASDGTKTLVNTEFVASKGFNLPSSPTLTVGDIHHVCDQLHVVLSSFAAKTRSE